LSLAKIARIAKEEQAEPYFQILPFPALAILAILARDILFPLLLLAALCMPTQRGHS
jgi:hypothetical protein